MFEKVKERLNAEMSKIYEKMKKSGQQVPPNPNSTLNSDTPQVQQLFSKINFNFNGNFNGNGNFNFKREKGEGRREKFQVSGFGLEDGYSELEYVLLNWSVFCLIGVCFAQLEYGIR